VGTLPQLHDLTRRCRAFLTNMMHFNPNKG
jgi:hypothetical protein